MPDYTPQSSLGLVSNPLGSVIDGLLQGHQLGLQMQAEQRANADEQLRQALGQQQITEGKQRVQESATRDLNDFTNNTRRVNSAGQVFAGENDPRLLPIMADAYSQPTPSSPQNQAPPTPAPGEPPYDPDPYAATPGQPSHVQSPGDALTAKIHADGGMWIPADKTRVVTYKDPVSGVTYTGERYTPQEMQAAADEHANKLLADKLNVTNPFVDTSQAIQKLTGLKKVRQNDYWRYQNEADAVQRAIDTNAQRDRDRDSRDTNASNALDAAELRGEANQTAETNRSAARNATQITVARMREKARNAGGGGATPNAQGVQSRFDQREIDNDTKLMEAAKTAQAAADARRSEIGPATGMEDGDDYADPLSSTGKTVTMNALQRARLKAEYDKATTLRDQKAAEVQRIMTKHGWGTPTAPPPGGTPPPAGQTAPPATPPPAGQTAPPATPPPAAKTPAAAAKPKYVEGQVMTNPKTKQSVIFKGGKWQPI